jgi:hypothetical protein
LTDEPTLKVRRPFVAAAGLAILGATLIEAYFQGFAFHTEHYVWPMEKYGVLSPLRWQDKVFEVLLGVVALLLLYAAYRLLRYAFRPART